MTENWSPVGTLKGDKGDKGDPGATGATGAAGTPGAAGAPGMLNGSGVPGGSALTAAVGTLYRDDAGTDGAWLWQKVAVGTTLAAWRVMHGFTGYRVLANSDLVSGWTNSNAASALSVTRSANWVTITAQLSKTGVTDQLICTLPVGFRPKRMANGVAIGSSGVGSRLLASTNGQVTMPGYATAGTGSTLAFAVTYYTEDAWPATATWPGTPG